MPIEVDPSQVHSIEVDPSQVQAIGDKPGFGKGLYESTIGGLLNTGKALYSAISSLPERNDNGLIEGMVKNQTDQFAKAKAAYNDPNRSTAQQLAGAAGYGLAGAIPVIGPLGAKLGEDLHNNPGYGAGEAVGTAASLALPEAMDALPVGTGAGAADALRAGAETDYAKALRPTRLATKAATENTVAPGLAARGVVSPSLSSLKDRAQFNMQDAAGRIDDFFDQQAQAGTKQDIVPILDKMDKYRQQFMVNGEDFNPQATHVINDATDHLINAADPQTGEIDLNSLRRIRQIYDQRTQNIKNWALDADQGSKVEAERQIPNAIRSTFADQYPELADANADYHFWKSDPRCRRRHNNPNTGASAATHQNTRQRNRCCDWGNPWTSYGGGRGGSAEGIGGYSQLHSLEKRQGADQDAGGGSNY